jgi:hypothetical protein
VFGFRGKKQKEHSFNEKDDALIEKSLKSLSLLFELANVKGKTLFDDFVIGYVWGYVDGILQCSYLKEEDDIKPLAITVIILNEIFSSKFAPEIVSRCIEASRRRIAPGESGSPIILGIMAGGQDSIDWCTKGKYPNRLPSFWRR